MNKSIQINILLNASGLASRPEEACEMHAKACDQAKYWL